MKEMIQKKRNECLQLVKVSNRKVNKVRKYWPECPRHKGAKIAICEKLKKQGKHFVCEARLINGQRPDILVLDDFKAIEIAVSESEKSLAEKRRKYKKLGLRMEVVRA